MIRGCASVFLLYLFFGNPTLATHGWWVTQSGALFSRKSTGVRQDLTSVAMATSRSLQVTTNMHAVPVPKKKKEDAFRGHKAYHQPSLAPLLMLHYPSPISLFIVQTTRSKHC